MIANPKAAFVCIGNEILSGKTQDSNTMVLAKWLDTQGVRLAEARIIADIEDDIIAAVTTMSNQYDYVFTSGGIGPTHDDITCASIAKAFHLPVILDQVALNILLDHYNGDQEISDSRKKMAYIPQGAVHIKNPISGAVGFAIKNVFVLAGVPSIFKSMLDDVQHMIVGGDQWYSKSLEVYCGESHIATELSEIQTMHKQVEIGSYPKYDTHKKYYTEIVFGGQNKMQNDSALDDTILMLKSKSIGFV